MKVTITILIMLLTLTIGLTNCSKGCESKVATCNESPPDDEECLAFFDRWFYNSDKNKCEEIGYSGCSQKGFETEEKCKECECNWKIITTAQQNVRKHTFT